MSLDQESPARAPAVAVRPGSAPVRWPGGSALLPVAVLTLLLGVVLRFSALHLGNGDTWFHLVLGDRFRAGESLTAPDGLTRFATSDWVPTQWSTEVLASQVAAWCGLPGVAVLFGILFLLLVLGVYAQCRRWARPAVAVVPVVLVVLASAPVLSARPQIVSLLLVLVTVGAWLRTLEDGRPRWWLVPMTWGWATAHGLWSAGVLIGLVCAVGVLLDRRTDGRRGLVLLLVPVLSLGAALLTPVGPRLVGSQLAVSARTSMIAEWGPTDFRTLPALAGAVLVVAVVVLWVRTPQCSWTRLGMLLLAGAWLLLVSRLVPLAAVVVAPLLAQAVETGLARRAPAPTSAPPGPRRRLPRGERIALLVLAVAYLGLLTGLAPRLAAEPADVPAALAPRLVALPEDSPVLVEDGVGGWIQWRVPQVDPVVDGLLDAYPVGYLEDFFAMTRVEPGWDRFVARSGARVAVVRAGSPLSAALQDRLGWRSRQRDGGWVYLTRP